LFYGFYQNKTAIHNHLHYQHSSNYHLQNDKENSFKLSTENK